jgi:hypothetical protein
MSDSKDLIEFNDPKSVAEFLRQPAAKIAEFITGMLVSDTKDFKLSAGRLVQASIKSKLFHQLGEEIKEYTDKGKIKEDYLDKDQNFQALSDLLEFIDGEAPDEDRFNAMTTLFIRKVSHDSTDEEQLLSYQFMKICKDLDSGDLLVIKAAYDIVNDNLKFKLSGSVVDKKDKSASNWFITISNQIGHGIASLVEVHEEKLSKLKLIGPRTQTDGSGIGSTKYYRLTDLGYKLCEYIYNKGV